MNIRRIAETAKDTAERLEPLSANDRRVASERGLACTIKLDPSRKYQEIIGFGGAITESAAYALSRLPERKRRELVSAYFDCAGGNGYTIARSHINSCDFSLENWACVPEKDESLGSFSMARPDAYLTPLLQAAHAAVASSSGGATSLRLMLSPWSPPAWMKDNGEMNHGGKLLPQYRATWARYIAKYLEAMTERGLRPWALSVQNEPAAVQSWDSCEWSAADEGEFVASFLGPELERSGRGEIKILVWDHNRDLLWDRLSGSLAVPGASEYIAGAAYHWYSGDQYDNVERCARAYPDKLLVFSEGCVEGGARDGAWFSGERYAHNIMGDLNAGCHAWIDWNILLDLEGGPNHAGNLCDAPVLADFEKGELRYQSSYYYIGHFSRFIKPGARRIGLRLVDSWMTPATVDGRRGNSMEACAFRNPSGEIVLVVCNRTEADMIYKLELEIGGQSELLRCPPRGIQSLVIG
jgi:O-Glycosyl hydrolase